MRLGRTIADTEAALGQATRLRQRLALALFDDVGREGDVSEALRRYGPTARRVVDDVNNATHGRPVTLPLTTLVHDAHRMIERLGEER